METLLDPQQIVPIVFSILAFITVVGVTLPLLQSDARAQQLKRVAERRRELSDEQRRRYQEKTSVRYQLSARASTMKQILQALRLSRLMEQRGLRQKLTRAGMRGQTPLVTFTFLRVAVPAGLAALAAVLLFSGRFELALAGKIIGVGIAAVFGYFLPEILLRNRIAKRGQAVQRGFPDALDLMVICVESGQSLEAAFGKVAEEMGDTAPELAEEFGLAAAEFSFLGDRRTPLNNLSERIDAPAVKPFVTSLIQAERYGTPVSTALRVVAEESRDTRMAAAEEKAASLPAKLTVPMVMFFLPVLFIVMIGPTVIRVIEIL